MKRDFTVSINTVPDMGDKRDIPIILNGVTQNDEYEGDFLTRRVLTYTLSFIMKNYVYGPVRDSEIIRKVNVRTYMEAGTGDISDVTTAGKVTDQTVEPTPSDADPDSTFTYNETTTFWDDQGITYSDDLDSDPK